MIKEETMPRAREEIKIDMLEKLVKSGQKKFVRLFGRLQQIVTG